MTSLQPKASGRNDAGAPGSPGSPGSPFGDPAQMQKMLKYLPLIMNVAKQAPGVIVGFVLTLVYMLAWVGRRGFRDTIAPVGGYHIVLFFLVRELLPVWALARRRIAALRARQSAQRSFHSDIARQYREALD